MKGARLPDKPVPESQFRDVKVGDTYESQDPRDTDPAQPNNRRRVIVLRVEGELAQIKNLTTGRKTVIVQVALLSSKWAKL